MAMQDFHPIHLRNHARREPGAIITVDYVYRTVKTLVVKKLWQIWRITAFCQVLLPIFIISLTFLMQMDLNSIRPAKFFLPNFLSTVLIHQTLLPPKFLLYGIHSYFTNKINEGNKTKKTLKVKG